MDASSLVPDFDEEDEVITVVVKVIYARQKERRHTRAHFTTELLLLEVEFDRTF